MKCLYFLASTLSTSEEVSNDLQAVGIKDFYVHVVSQDESGLKQRHVHSSNYLETRDIFRDGLIGGAIGLAVGLLGVGLLVYLRPFGDDVNVPTYVYAILATVATLFGAWEGGLTGIANENKKLARFHDEIASGKYLILVYVRKRLEDQVRAMMQAKHPEAALVGIDSHYINPFFSVQKITSPSA